MLRKSILAALLLVVPLGLLAEPATAGPGKGKYKHAFKSAQKGGYAHVYKHKGGPPPWAPAHGYRRHKHGHHHHGGDVAYVAPFNIGLGNCNRELLGGLLGAAAGGFAGSKIGDGRGQLAAVAGGTLLGFLVGGSIGRSMDEVDQNCIGQTLEHAGDGQRVAWKNPESGTRYQVVPAETVQQADGGYCREYTTTAVIDGRSQETVGIACRQPDGAWKLVD